MGVLFLLMFAAGIPMMLQNPGLRHLLPDLPDLPTAAGKKEPE